MMLRLSDIRSMLQATPPRSDHQIRGYSIDSRSLAPGDLFFAIRGPHFDGHDFIASALERGAAAAVVRRPWMDTCGDTAGGGDQLIPVDDPLRALQQLAAQARHKWGGPLVAVTGSNGKTTTKEAISTMLATRYRVAKSEGNLNNELGLPLSLLRIADDAEIAVVEMGMNHRGEIRLLAEIAQPTVGLVTNVNSVHLENFSSLEEVALAKRELIECLAPDGTAVLNADDDRVQRFAEIHRGPTVTFGLKRKADFQATDVEELGARGLQFRLRTASAPATVEFISPLVGRHNVANLTAAIAVAAVFQVEPASLVGAVARLQPMRMRGEVCEIGGVLVLNDCYNANPPAMAAMLDVLRQTQAVRKIAVLGEMLELGAESVSLHRQVGREVARDPIDILIGVQGDAQVLVEAAVASGFPAASSYMFDNAAQAGDFLAAFLQSGDAVLFKASRGVGMERALESVQGRCPNQSEPVSKG